MFLLLLSLLLLCGNCSVSISDVHLFPILSRPMNWWCSYSVFNCLCSCPYCSYRGKYCQPRRTDFLFGTFHRNWWNWMYVQTTIYFFLYSLLLAINHNGLFIQIAHTHTHQKNYRKKWKKEEEGEEKRIVYHLTRVRLCYSMPNICGLILSVRVYFNFQRCERSWFINYKYHRNMCTFWTL